MMVPLRVAGIEQESRKMSRKRLVDTAPNRHKYQLFPPRMNGNPDWKRSYDQI
jgi:hypothetical protein